MFLIFQLSVQFQKCTDIGQSYSCVRIETNKIIMNFKNTDILKKIRTYSHTASSFKERMIWKVRFKEMHCTVPG